MTRWRRPAVALALVLGAAGPSLGAGPAAAQGMPVLHELAIPSASCPTIAPATVSAADRAAAQRLREEADASTLAGDAAGARDRLQRAAALDPTDPELAYRLARAHEELEDAPAARREYCRMQALARSADDTSEARSRLSALGAAAPEAAADPMVVRFRAGLARAAAGDLAGAEQEFTTVLERWPHHPAPLLNRAAIRVARGNTGPALADLDRYVAAVPEPLPRALATRDVLRASQRDPSGVLAMGVIPGGAQVASGRPVAAAFVAAVAAAGIVLALRSETVQREQRFTDPFGNPYTEMVEVQEHPQRMLGLSVSAAALVGGALEGFLRVTGARRRAERLQVETAAELRAPTVGAAGAR